MTFGGGDFRETLTIHQLSRESRRQGGQIDALKTIVDQCRKEVVELQAPTADRLGLVDARLAEVEAMLAEAKAMHVELTSLRDLLTGLAETVGSLREPLDMRLGMLDGRIEAIKQHEVAALQHNHDLQAIRAELESRIGRLEPAALEKERRRFLAAIEVLETSQEKWTAKVQAQIAELEAGLGKRDGEAQEVIQVVRSLVAQARDLGTIPTRLAVIEARLRISSSSPRATEAVSAIPRQRPFNAREYHTVDEANTPQGLEHADELHRMVAAREREVADAVRGADEFGGGTKAQQVERAE